MNPDTSGLPVRERDPRDHRLDNLAAQADLPSRPMAPTGRITDEELVGRLLRVVKAIRKALAR